MKNSIEYYYTILKNGTMQYFDTIEDVLKEVPKTYQKIEISKFEKMMMISNNRKALSFTHQQIKLTNTISINGGEEIEILDEWVMVSKKTYNNLIN